MPVNFTDSPSNGDTVTSGGFIYTYDSTNARWKSSAGTSFNTEEVQDVAGAMFTGNTETGITATYQDSDGTVDLVVPEATGITVYATFALLVAVTGMSTGDLAYVTATNKLYLYSVNGWFLVATVSNSSPTAITGVGATTSLATDGTATVITAVSTDPEGFALTWSYAVTTGSLTNGGGATATVSQNANVFTITPTTTEAYAGTFSITFTVTDGTTGAVNAVSAFTLAFAYDWTATAQQAKLVASNPSVDDYFGFATDIEDDTAIVSAKKEDTTATDSGAVYIFTRSGTTWSQQAMLKTSDPESGDELGESIAISGNTVIAGAKNEDTGGTNVGAAYVFTRSGTTWTQQQKIQLASQTASDYFGYAAAIDGDTAIVGAPLEDTTTTESGAVFVFTRSGTTWSQQAMLKASDTGGSDYYGITCAIDSDTVVVGAPYEDAQASNAGAAYIFTRSGTTWTQQQKLASSDMAANDYFGRMVSISGDTVIVGAYGKNSHTGAAYVFTRSGTTWSQQQKLQSSDIQSADSFGGSVAIEDDTIIVGAYNEDTGGSNAGSVYIFTRSGTTWTQDKKLQSSDIQTQDNFGKSVGISGNTAIISAWLEDTGGSNAGAAYTFIAG
jgi:hypothetical protein